MCDPTREPGVFAVAARAVIDQELAALYASQDDIQVTVTVHIAQRDSLSVHYTTVEGAIRSKTAQAAAEHELVAHERVKVPVAVNVGERHSECT